MSTFTAADRRKKVVTYGKKSRPSIIPTPPPDLAEEPPSPDRPRKIVAPKNGLSKSRGGSLKSAKPLEGTRTIAKDYDIFEVPSDDEFTFRPIKPAKKVSKHRTTETPIAEAESSTHIRKQDHSRASQQLLNPKASRPAVPDAKTVRNSDRLPALAKRAPPKAESTTAPPVRRGRTPQPTQYLNEEEAVQRPVANSKTVSRATTPAVATSKTNMKVKATPATTLQKAAIKPAKKATDNMDVYDMPPSDDEVIVPPQKPLRTGRILDTKNSVKQPQKPKDVPLKNTAESDDSNASRKRKRRGSVSSVTTSKAPVDRKINVSAPQRSRKVQRKEDRIWPLQEGSKHSSVAPAQVRTSPAVPTINKPRRTRQLTVPVFTQRTMNKGHSSPAQLGGMLPGKLAAKSSPIPEAPESPRMEDETMYEIPDPLTTPVRPSKSTVSGSVTPRQKALFSTLLGDSSSRTPTQSLATLTLTDQRPRTLLGALSKSKSDLTYSAQARKTRLIDTLKNEDASSDDDEDIDVSDGESEASSTQSLTEDFTGSSKRVDQAEDAQISNAVYAEDMDIESEPAVEAQTSQAISTFGSRARFTYAKTRSYLEEVNPEDALLIMDDDLGFDSQTKDGLSGDDEDPVSQVQATHVLKRKGQQNTFNDDVRMYIDDLKVTSGNTVRRSAILELCSKMKDESFTNQLLDSTLASSFFGNIESNGEIIFDVVTAVAMIFIIKANSTSVVLNQIYRAGVVTRLLKLTSNDVDLRDIARNRKTNLSKIAVDSVKNFRDELMGCPIWSHHTPSKLTPQRVALQALESLVLGLRGFGSNDSLLDHSMVSSLIDVASNPCARIKDGKADVYDSTVTYYIFSILESMSLSRQKQSLWPVKTLERLAELMPVVVGLEEVSSTILAVKLCMNLTNNKPKACLSFSSREFIQPLAAAVIRNFARLRSELSSEERTTVLDTLTLTLGALVNLAEFSDQARSNVDDGQQMISTLVRIFLEGSERAARAQSIAESRSNVPVGYLTVLLGNLSLNASIRMKVRAQLPEQRLDVLITKVQEFVQYHEHVDSKTKQYEGAEGRETSQNYTARLMLVVEKLKQAER
ncbi:hypothetical protein T440DRAFT_211926 [Plenodomus tracheiphilus IPT5]|uniref:Wings apart-like protein C-terminal domain-containing protein n=1 Tax=Plenodomus tracheiphilus IPT5 TaxID=1408161 RepID=A0A6A7AWV4_9PLEO|nr:hypothetical protein T440DRAFT_211926 [Plenodomus tracheiphilus IPT5]